MFFKPFKQGNDQFSREVETLANWRNIVEFVRHPPLTDTGASFNRGFNRCRRYANRYDTEHLLGILPVHRVSNPFVIHCSSYFHDTERFPPLVPLCWPFFSQIHYHKICVTPAYPMYIPLIPLDFYREHFLRNDSARFIVRDARRFFLDTKDGRIEFTRDNTNGLPVEFVDISSFCVKLPVPPYYIEEDFFDIVAFIDWLSDRKYRLFLDDFFLDTEEPVYEERDIKELTKVLANRFPLTSPFSFVSPLSNRYGAMHVAVNRRDKKDVLRAAIVELYKDIFFFNYHRPLLVYSIAESKKCFAWELPDSKDELVCTLKNTAVVANDLEYVFVVKNPRKIKLVREATNTASNAYVGILDDELLPDDRNQHVIHAKSDNFVFFDLKEFYPNRIFFLNDLKEFLLKTFF